MLITNTKRFKRIFTRAYFSKLFIFWLLYFVSAKIGLTLDAVSGFATPVWIPTGISLALILLYGYKYWPGIFLAALLVNYSTGAPPLGAFLIALGNTLESIVGSYLIKKVVDPSDIGKTLKGNTALVICGAVVGPLISASIGVTSLKLTGVITQYSQLLPTLIAWWIGDALGALVITPAVIAWSEKTYAKITNYYKILELALLFSSLIFLCLVIFWNIFHLEHTNGPILYFLFLPLILSSLRYKPRITLTLNLLLSVISILATISGVGPFIAGSLSQSLILLQLFIAVITLITLTLSGVAYEKSKTAEELWIANIKLEVRSKELEEVKILDEEILKSVGDGLIVTDKNGKIIRMSLAMEDLTGWKIEEAINRQTIERIFLENEKGPVLPNDRPINIALEKNEKVVINYLYCKRKDGTKFPVSITAAPFSIGNKIVGVVEIFRDITEQKEIDKAKSEFISIASHQLRTPLGAIKWSYEIIKKSPYYKRSPKKVREHLEDIGESTERLISLVRDLLSVSRIDQGKVGSNVENTNIMELITDAANKLKREADKKNIGIKVVEPEENFESRVYVDPNRFREVIENLISNSIKYGKDDGNITIRLKRDNNNILISIEDNGIGINKKDEAHIFEKFFRSSNAFTFHKEGTGLGLYIVKNYVEKWNGKVWFDSKEGVGSTFYVSLPLV